MRCHQIAQRIAKGVGAALLCGILAVEVAELTLQMKHFPLATPVNTVYPYANDLPLFGFDAYTYFSNALLSKTDICMPSHDEHGNKKLETISASNHFRQSRSYIETEKPYHVLCLGCSYTYGCDVNDSDTFVWRLNEIYANTSFDNAGLLGTNTIADLLRLKSILQAGKHYDLVLYFPINDQITRTFIPRHEYYPDCDNNASPGLGQAFLSLPYVEIDGSVYPPTLTCHPELDERWPGDDLLRCVNYAKIVRFNLTTAGYRRQLEREQHAWHKPASYYQRLLALGILMVRMQELCQQHGAEFGVMSLTDVDDGEGTWINTRTLLPHFIYANIRYPVEWLNIHETSRGRIKTAHPDAKVHEWYALSIAREIGRQKLLPAPGRRLRPGADLNGFETCLREAEK